MEGAALPAQGVLGPHPPQLTVVDEYVNLSLSPKTSAVPWVHQAGVDDVTLNLRVVDFERRSMLDSWRMGRGRLGTLGRDGFADLWPPHQAFWYPRTGTLSVDVKRARKSRLLPGDGVRGAAQEVVGVLVDAGILDRGARPYASGEMTCSRLDVAVDIAMPSPEEGRNVLHALELMHEWGGLYVDLVGRPGERTVYHKRRRERGRDRIVARVYSRHREELGSAPGGIVRFEVERRYKPSVEARSLTPGLIRDLWLAHFIEMAPANGKVRIGDREAVLVQLARRVAAGEITYTQMEQAATFLQLEKLGLLAEAYPARMIKERRRLVKRLGVRVSDVQDRPVEVDVGAVVALGVDGQHWAS